MSINQTIGKNIRTLRKRSGLSIADLADIVSEYECGSISDSLLGAWQRGQRNISAEHLVCVASALNCTVDALTQGDAEPQQRLAHQLAHLPLNEQEIIQYGAHEWDGDVNALVQANGAYMALPPTFRFDVVSVLISMYRIAERRGLLCDVPYQIRMEYMNRKWQELHK